MGSGCDRVCDRLRHEDDLGFCACQVGGLSDHGLEFSKRGGVGEVGALADVALGRPVFAAAGG